jgi:hypothetical protein
MAQTISPKGRVAVLSDEQALEDGLNNDFTLPSLFKISTKGAKFNVFGINGSITSPEVADAVARWTNPTVAMVDALTVFVTAEVANGNWGTKASSYTDSLYNAFWLFGGVNSDVNALTDLHQVLKLTAINNGATRVADGFDFDGIDDSIDSKVSPSLHTLQNDVMYGAFAFEVDTGFLFGQFNGVSSERINVQSPSLNANVGLNSLNNITTIDSAAKTYHVVSRIGAFDWDYIVDGVVQKAVDSTSTSPSSITITVGARNRTTTPDVFYTGIISTFMAGKGVGFNQSDHNTNVRTLLTSLGVLP